MVGRHCTQVEQNVLNFVSSRPCVTDVHETGISNMAKPVVKTQKCFDALLGVRNSLLLSIFRGGNFHF